MNPEEQSNQSVEQGANEGRREESEDSRRDFLSTALASSAALAGLGLLAQALGSSEAAAAQTPAAAAVTLRGSPVKFRALEDGIRLEISSRELAQHLASEGVIDPKHSQGIATVRYDLLIG